MYENFIVITLFLLVLFYISKTVESCVMYEDETDYCKETIDDMISYFRSQKYLGELETNFADISTHLSVYEGEPSCSFIYMNNRYKCFVSGKNESQRIALLEILSNIVDKTYSKDKMIWIKPYTGVKHFNGFDYFEA